MKYFVALVFIILCVLSAWPAVGLWRVLWQDRKLPKGHPDYAGLFWGKRMVGIAATCCTLFAAFMAWLVSWCLK